MVAKFDSLLKHQSCPKTKVFMPSVDAKSFLFNKNYVHVHNERLYIANDHPPILDQLQIYVPLEHK
jgi:hypothetical protein